MKIVLSSPVEAVALPSLWFPLLSTTGVVLT